jgi:hypothetical protein
MRFLNRALAVFALAFCALVPVYAAQAPENAQAAAPFDLTGYWVALVTEDWRFRMMTAPTGDYQGINLTPLGQQVANAWDPAADTAAGQACKAYGAGGIMRMPTRLHITWADENVLSIATDAGRQTRLLKFGPAQDGVGAGSLQGVSNARWDLQRAGRFGPVVNGTLEVLTTGMQAGYLRRNGVPYSDQARLTEYFERVTRENGDEYLIVISVLEDPVYLSQSVLTSTNFKKEPDGSKWAPGDCVAKL